LQYEKSKAFEGKCRMNFGGILSGGGEWVLILDVLEFFIRFKAFIRIKKIPKSAKKYALTA
jgi:hypothetical protein